MNRFVFASLLGLALFVGALTSGGITPAMAQGKIYYGPGGPEYRAAEPPQRQNARRDLAPRFDDDRRGYRARRGYTDYGDYGYRREHYGDSGYRRAYGPRTGYYYGEPRRYYHW